MPAWGTNYEITGASGTGYSTVSDQDDTLNLNLLIGVSPFMINIFPPSAGVQFYRDGIIFLSNSRSEVRMLESHTSFGAVEAYYAPLEDTIIGNREIFSSTDSWSVPCEAMTFNSDYSVMYFTKIPSKRESEKIFEAKYQIYRSGKSSWITDNKPLSFCSDKSVYSHPTLSADGEKMVFVSDTRGSVGGLDLFISYKEGEDWSSPINLGNLINTQGNEMYPFLDQEDNLFFSSDGIDGFGGYDIFFCRYSGRGWDKPVNLTQIVNTTEDDLAFTLNRLDGRSAFFSKRDRNGSGAPQLYRITFNKQYATNDLADLSDTFKYLAQARLLAYETGVIITEAQPDTEKPEIEPVKEPEKEPVVPVQEKQQITEEKPEPVTVKAPFTSDTIIYRVQFLSSTKPKGSYEINIGGVPYQTYEYLYAGAYRHCVGEFYSPSGAINLQNSLRRNGYSDAFVVAFRNDQRLTGSMLALAMAQEPAEKESTRENIQTQIPDVTLTEPVRPVTEPEQADENAIIYRVQFLASSQPKGSFQITAGGITYNTYEYFYVGAYRSCAGEFSTMNAANKLRDALRKEGYTDAFVAAFINNKRVTDPALLR